MHEMPVVAPLSYLIHVLSRIPPGRALPDASGHGLAAILQIHPASCEHPQSLSRQTTDVMLVLLGVTQGLQVLATCSSFQADTADESSCISGDAYPLLAEEAAQQLLHHVQACADAVSEQHLTQSGLPLLNCKVGGADFKAYGRLGCIKSRDVCICIYRRSPVGCFVGRSPVRKSDCQPERK